MWNYLATPPIDDRKRMDGGGEGTNTKEDNGGREWYSTAAMTVYGGVAVGLWLCLRHAPSKIMNGSELRVSVRVYLVLGYTGSCGNMSRKRIFNDEKWLQWRRNSELIMALKSANICYYFRTITNIDDDVVRMCPSDLIGCDNRSTKGVRLGQLELGEPVSH